MFEVYCPGCNETRHVKDRQKWMKDEIEPFVRDCKRCCQKKPKSDEHKANLSTSIKAIQTPEVIQRKKQYSEDHPELRRHLIPGQGGGWNKGLILPARSEETKQKISDGVKQSKDKNNE